MPFGFLRDDGDDRLDHVEVTLRGMFDDVRHAFDLAMAALLGETVPHDGGAEVRTTDRRVNEAERVIRRELVVHASVHGSSDTPAVLVYMSIVKDVERIGDYAKNIFDLAADGARLQEGTGAASLLQLRDEVSSYIAEAGEVFAARDAERARPLLASGDELLDGFDDRVSALVRGDDRAEGGVARALLYRYLKRIVAHLMNVLSAVVMPVDQLDYFDEDPEDRR
jgi:Na+/phosphate symporter